jgi:hypothetical protein
MIHAVFVVVHVIVVLIVAAAFKRKVWRRTTLRRPGRERSREGNVKGDRSSEYIIMTMQMKEERFMAMLLIVRRAHVLL